MTRTAQCRLSIVLALCIAANACGGGFVLTAFRQALQSDQLVNFLLSRQEVTPEKAELIRTDFRDGVGCAQKTEDAFKAISNDLPDAEKRTRKLNASVGGLQCFRAIINRGNFKVHQRVVQAADIAETILATLVTFYSGGGTRGVAPSPKAIIVRDEKELEQKLKEKVKELELVMEPH
jgi:hypothetical protein